ncbi:hypothetical protein TNIN_268711, partial [Trichonephila inaurata madagascariensis]
MSVGKHFNQHEVTVGIIKENEAACGKSVCSGTRLSAKSSSSYARDIDRDELEQTL